MCRLRPTPARLRNLGHPNCHKTVVKPTFYIPSLLAECTGVMKSKRFPQCEERSKRPKQNLAVRRPIVTKRSTAKTDAPHPRHSAKACDNNTQTTWRFGKDWQQSLLLQAGLETFNQQPCSPGSWRSVGFEKALLLLKLCQFWQKRVTAGIFGAVNTLTFWTPRSGPPQNDTPRGTGIRSVS